MTALFVVKNMQRMLDVINQNYILWKSTYDVKMNGSEVVSKRKNYYPPMTLDMPTIKAADDHLNSMNKTVSSTANTTTICINGSAQKTAVAKIPAKKLDVTPNVTPMITRQRSLKTRIKSIKSEIMPQIHSTNESVKLKLNSKLIMMNRW